MCFPAGTTGALGVSSCGLRQAPGAGAGQEALLPAGRGAGTSIVPVP